MGKSVVARLLAQYCIDHGTPFVAVDADASHASLRRFYGDYTRTVDLTRLESVDEIMSLATEVDRRVLVDLPAQSEQAVASWIKGAGIFEFARECGVRIVFWHVMDDGKDSLMALDRLLERYGTAARYCIVRNFGRGRDFSLFEGSPIRARAHALGASVIDLPELQETAMRKIDRLDASYWAAAHNSVVGADAFTRMDRQRVKVWLQTWSAEIACLTDIV